ncbi:uncharacterized protein LOC111704974 [Eurytemora carolleeae]|uniref:uncharacterized protein LOC111704974 n=1 Tax=Eurytemora carolleeae TaxID=1294199 RepID=UPI000C765E7A|nr:uncharacterized protein LOC111704974 [Eurytemora carolleeae]|eukprot:XP_023333150.1 uncharacterized protein LOC111704974 [Eurytemora affinis]
MVNITILNSNVTQVLPDDIVGRCLKVDGKLVCNLKALMKDDKSSVKLEIDSPTGFIPEPQLDIRVSASSACSKKVFSENLRIDIKQIWDISATPTSADKTLIWRENTPDRNKEELQIVKHEFQIINSGPSMNSESEILVFLPSDHPLTNEASVVLGGNPCTEEGDLEFRRIPPQPSALPHQNVENVFCSIRAMCRVISCKLAPLYPSTIYIVFSVFCSIRAMCRVISCKLAPLYPSTSNSIMLSVSYNFSIGGAENSSHSVFQLVTGVITVDYRNQERKAVSSTTFKFSATTFLEEVLNYYELIMALVACIVLIVLINFVFKYFDVFNKVRIYKNKHPDEGLELMDNNEEIIKDEVDTAGVLLRN